MRCDLHCPPATSVLRGPLRAAGALAAVAFAVYVAYVVASAWLVVLAALAVLTVLAAVVVWVSRWSARFALVGRPVRVANRVTLHAQAALPAPPLAIEAPGAVPAVVLLDMHDGERLDV